MGRFAKHIGLFFVACIFLVGCASVSVPNYIKDAHPYEKKVYADFDTTEEAVTEALKDLGWKIIDTADPETFEETKKVDNPDVDQVLLFTNIRKSTVVIGSKFQRLNVYLQSVDPAYTEIDLRYLKVSSYPFKSFTRYKNQKIVDRIFKKIDEKLNQK